MQKLNKCLILEENWHVKDRGCCPTMHQQLNWECEDHKGDHLCPDVIITKTESGDYYLHGKNGTYLAYFCPWCGKTLSTEIAKECL
jgi:hypothetical protein